MLLSHLHLPAGVGVQAARLLATADFTVANRVSEDVARVVEWSFAHHQDWLAVWSIGALQRLDELGGVLITLVAWIVTHCVS